MGTLYKRDRSPFWWMAFEDHAGRRVQKSTGCRDKTNAAKVLAKMESDAALVEYGVKSPVSDRANEPLVNHVDEYEKFLTTQRSPKYARQTKREIMAVADFCGWVKLRDVSGEGLESFIIHLSDESRGARTVGSYINAVRMFCRWCIDRKRMVVNPTTHIKKPGVKSRRKYSRRMLLHEEWSWLKRSIIAEGETRNGLEPEERMLMYWTAIETGLRSGELQALTKDSLKLSAKEPHILAAANTTKNAQTAKQFISDGLAAALRKHVAHKLPDAPVFKTRSKNRMAEAIRADIEQARLFWVDSPKHEKSEIEKQNPNFLIYKTSEGVADFHALRHTTGAWLVQAGVTLPEVQAIMRHSTITLTIDAYGHLAPDAASRHRNLLNSMVS